MQVISCATKTKTARARSMKIAVIAAAMLTLAGCKAPNVQGHCGGNGGNPYKPGPDQKVELKWKTTEWKVKLNGGPEENPKSAKTTLAQCTGPTMFEVDIQNSAPATFKASGALSVWHDSKAPGNEGSTQILGPVVSADGKKLVFFDLNQGEPVHLFYGFNFNEAGTPPADPIIDNGGGN